MSRSFSYMLHLETLKELEKLGIRFESQIVDNWQEEWPALILPSGTALLISRDDEGNGPGSIHDSRKGKRA